MPNSHRKGAVMSDLPSTRRHLTFGGTVRRITKAALGGLAGCALLLGGTQAAGGVSSVVKLALPEIFLSDVEETEGAFDGAKATLRIMETPDGTAFKLQVTKIGSSAEGKVFGAHLHTGPCVEGDYADPSASPTPKPAGSKAGPHYHQGVGSSLPESEVWFELRPNARGVATDDTFASFEPVDPDGIMSIVIHVAPTNPETGAAGARQACYPLDVKNIFPAVR